MAKTLETELAKRVRILEAGLKRLTAQQEKQVTKAELASALREIKQALSTLESRVAALETRADSPVRLVNTQGGRSRILWAVEYGVALEDAESLPKDSKYLFRLHPLPTSKKKRPKS